MLRWARTRAGLSEDELARKMSLVPQRVLEWEATGQIKLNWVQRLADKTHTPYGALYLAEPPVETLPVADFRTVGSGALQTPSPELLDTLGLAMERQDWFREFAIEAGEDKLDWVGALKGNEKIEDAARWICENFALETAARAQAKTWEDAMRHHCEDLENAGVLVMRNSVVGDNNSRPLDVEEFRGFVLADEYAPLLFINSRDWKAAQMFTLMHELVHLVLNVSGVSNLEQTYAPPKSHEQFCNAVAAEILVPLAELSQKFAQGIEEVAELGRHFKVSLIVILRRLLDAGLLSKNDFAREYAAQVAQYRSDAEKLKEKEGGGSYYNTKGGRLGKRFSRALIESTLEGRTAFREAFHLLGVRNGDALRRYARELNFRI